MSLKSVIDLVFPSLCPSCGHTLYQSETQLCLTCLQELPVLSGYDQQNLRNKLHGRVKTEHMLAFLKFHKKGITQEIIHHIKYRNRPDLAIYMGQLFIERLNFSTAMHSYDMLIPVPLHPKKLRKRGYNQSEVFARGLSEAINIPVLNNFLVRQVYTKTQTRKSREKRWQNVKDAFVVKTPENLTNKNVILVDDVITTGATLEACATKLIDAGIGKLSIVALADAN